MSPIAETGLSPDKRLAFTYAPARNRSALAALFGVDAAMGEVVRTTTEPMLAPIRLAWWRERLEELDQGHSAPAEPRLQAVERELLPRGIHGTELAGLEAGWLTQFDPFPWTVETSEAIWFRGRTLFWLGASLLGRSGEAIQGAGGIWALVDAARHCSDAQSRAMLLSQARTFSRGLANARFDWGLRPLSMLAVLAVRDLRHGEPFEPEGTPARAATMLRHRFSGRLKQP